MVDAIPLTNLTGTVASVAVLPDPHAMALWDPIVYTTKVRIDEALSALRPGMTARAEIKISELDKVLTLPNASVVRFDGKDQAAVQRSDGGFEWRPVELGASNDALSEVKQGLKAGEIVALKPESLLTEAQKRKIAASLTPPAANRQPGSR
jgi:multidrug efflux pump subunit AcrA (membrane-fusion protein)